MAQVLTEAQAIAAWGKPPKPRGLKAVKVDGLLFTWIDHPGAIKALERLSDILVKHGYEVRAIDTGTYNPRFIGGTTVWSRHAWPTAIDVNWKSNPDGKKLVTDMPKAMVAEIVALRTNSGEQVWRWGGDWDTRPETPHGYYDAMHFELIAHPRDLDTGIAEVEEDVALSPKAENTAEYWVTALEAAGANDFDKRKAFIDKIIATGLAPAAPAVDQVARTEVGRINALLNKIKAAWNG